MPYKHRPRKTPIPFNLNTTKYRLARYAQYCHHHNTTLTTTNYKNFYTGKLDNRQLHDAITQLTKLQILTPTPQKNTYTYNPKIADPILDEIYRRNKQETNEKAIAHARNTLHNNNQ